MLDSDRLTTVCLEGRWWGLPICRDHYPQSGLLRILPLGFCSSLNINTGIPKNKVKSPLTHIIIPKICLLDWCFILKTAEHTTQSMPSGGLAWGLNQRHAAKHTHHHVWYGRGSTPICKLLHEHTFLCARQQVILLLCSFLITCLLVCICSSLC